LNQHPSVHEAVVIAREDHPGDKRLVAYLVSNRESPLMLDELRRYLKEKLPEYMVPSAFVLLEALPLTPNGKVDRRALPAPEAVMSQNDEEKSVIGPRDPVERILMQIWVELLKREPIGVQDNFFELGGHSLLVVQVAYRIREIFRIEFPVQRFFESPTIAELAQIIQAIRRGESVVGQPESAGIDFEAEATLDPNICPEIKTEHLTEEPASIFLTGATGFLGAFLLHELLQQTQADVYCLVRSVNVEEGRKRIQDTLESYTLWNEGLAPRIVPIPGDLSQPLLGLSGEQFEMLAGQIESIYHCGAFVNFIYPYTALKAPNVLGTKEILKLTCHTTIKPLHYISTNDAVGNAEGPLVRECELSNPNEALDDGYSKSKWVAEKLVTIARHRGLPVCIYRPGTITGHSQTGIWNTGDFVSRVIKGCIQMGSIPDQTIIEDMTPVDYVSQGIVYLSKQPESLKQVFHLVNPQPLSWNTLAQGIRSYGYPIREVSYEQWQEQLIQLVKNQSENALHTLLPLFLEPEENAQKSEDQETEPRWFDCLNALAGLANTSIVCPPVDENLLQTYFSYFIRSGFLEPPQVETKMQ
jgi:thioester reductase-like protein